MRFDPVLLVESCYSQGLETAWAHGLLHALSAFDRGLGLAAFAFEVETGSPCKLRLLAVTPSFSRDWNSRTLEVPREHPRLDALAATPSRAIHSLRKTSGALRLAVGTLAEALLAAEDIDILVILGVERPGVGICILAPYFRQKPPSPPQFDRLSRLVWHLGAAQRARRRVTAAVQATLGSAVDGHPRSSAHSAGAHSCVQRAEVSSRPGELARSLRGALHQTREARWLAPAEADSHWREFLAARWSLVDHVDAEGNHCVVAVKAPPGVDDPRAITPGEAAVLALAARGHSNKEIAFELRLAPSTVADRLRASQHKLGIASRHALIAMWARAANIDPIG